MKSIKLLILALVAASAVSCGASKKAESQPVTGGDVEILVPCSGLEYVSSPEFFRANAMGLSNSLEIASSKAMTSARAKIAANIQTTIQTTTDSYLTSYEEGAKEEAAARFQSLTREVVNQKLAGVRVICQKTMKTPEGQYKCYVALELSGADMAAAMANKVNSDSKLRTDFEYKKYEETFNAEMKKHAENQ